LPLRGYIAVRGRPKPPLLSITTGLGPIGNHISVVFDLPLPEYNTPNNPDECDEGKMGHSVILIVANEPSEETEAEYNEWYNEKHVPMMFRFKGMRKASRYRLAGENKECSRYLAIYEFNSKEDLEAFPKSSEFAEAVRDFDEKWKDGGFERKWGGSYELIKSWEKMDLTR
jgi:heme-degrading monooxygenase HmoA